jgi:formylglycine-generating enzyme required for sulfatase activity
MTVVRSIFMSYRRCDSVDVTGRIHDRLVAQFGPASVFKDVDAIPLGVDFRQHLEREVSHCPALLAIIGPDWLNAPDGRGNRRLDNPSDWVRIEIETALQRDSVVIPVLVGGARLPKDHELPESLKGLAYRQSALVRTDPDFHRDVDRLIQRIEEVFKGLTLKDQPESKPSSHDGSPYATLIDDLTIALTQATQSTQTQSVQKITRRRWLRLMGLGMLGAGSALATHRWWPYLQTTYGHRWPQSLPTLSSLPDRLQAAWDAATQPNQNQLNPQSTARYTYQSVTVDSAGMPLYQTNFATDFYEVLRLEAAGYAADLPLVAITGGQFLFGLEEEDPNLQAMLPSTGQNTPTIARVDSFWMGTYPITQRQWRTVAHLPQVDRQLNPDPAYFRGDDHPVEQVSWPEAVEFCRRLSRYTGQRFRLPTEPEWEFACRAKTTTPFHFGQTLTPDLANYNGTQSFRSEGQGIFRGQTTPVGALQKANDFGLYDMHGNVWEWCADRGMTLPNAEQESSDPPLVRFVDTEEEGTIPILPSPSARILRGGSWKSKPHHCQSAYRYQLDGDTHSNTIGFRVMREVESN